MLRPIRAPARASDSTISSVACVGRPPAAIAATTRRSGGSRSGSTTTLRSRAVSSRVSDGTRLTARPAATIPRVASGSSLSNAIFGSNPASRQTSRIRPGEVADGPWIHASSRRAARSTVVLLRQRVGAGHDGVHRLLEQRALLHAGRRRGAQAAERHREVDVAPQELGQRLLRAALVDRHVGVGQQAAQVGDRERDEPGQRRGVCGEPHPALLAPDQVGDLLLGERQPVERGARVLDEQRPGRRSALHRRASGARAARRPRPPARRGAGRRRAG